jgi:hypothetical protein
VGSDAVHRLLIRASLIVAALEFEAFNSFAADAAAAALREAGFDASVVVVRRSVTQDVDVVSGSDVPSGLEAAVVEVVRTHAADAHSLDR